MPKSYLQQLGLSIPRECEYRTKSFVGGSKAERPGSGAAPEIICARRDRNNILAAPSFGLEQGLQVESVVREPKI